MLVQHDESEFQKGFADIVQAAYKDLFDLHGVEAWAASPDKLISFFRNTDHTSDIVGRRQASTFQTLANIAGMLDGKLPKAATAKAKKVDSATPKKQATKVAAAKSSGSPDVPPPAAGAGVGARADAGSSCDMALTVRIEINLPASGDKETYDNIFKSIRENLVNGKVS